MIFLKNIMIIYFSVVLIFTGYAMGKCPESMLDCCGTCYYPSSEECIKLTDRDCKIVEQHENLLPKIQPIEPNGENICDLINEGKIEVETEGSGISSLTLKIEPKVDFNIKVSIPQGTFFPAKSGSSQNMISTKDITVELKIEPGFDISVEKQDQPSEGHWIHVNVPVACTNIHKAIPGSSDTFEIERSPNQEELEKLLPVLEAEGVSYSVKQAAIWIITDNADYSDLGTLISESSFGNSGARVINEYEAVEAMRLIDKAGIDIQNKAIWEDRDMILEGLTNTSLKEWLLHKTS